MWAGGDMMSVIHLTMSDTASSPWPFHSLWIRW